MGNSHKYTKPFAFEAREFLRGLLIGKTVAFKTEYTTTSNQREFGSLLLQVPMDGETDVTRILVKQGWAKVKSSEGRHEASEAQQALLDLEKEAQESKKGIWADDGNGSHGPRSFSVNLQPADSEPKDFLAKYKGQPLPAVLELVRDATTFRACITLPTVPQSYQYVTLLLAGVKGPVLRKGIPNVPDQVEPFAEEGKFFVESRLLQKDVQVVLEGLSGNVSSSSSNQAYPSFIGSIRFPLGNISLLLLSEGFAKVNDWTLSMVTLDGDKYRDSEKRAKDKRLRQWKEYVPSAPSAPMESTFEAVVTKIVGPDLLLVEPIRSNKSLNVERKIQLSSIRGPKRQKNETGLEIGYYSEAVEFLRSRLVGKKVQVTMDYIKPAEGEYESRDCATLLNGAQNMAEALVSKGLAQVIRHKKDDENRSQKYDALLV